MTATDQDNAIAGLPVIAELLARHGKPFGQLDGRPVPLPVRPRVTRMVWVWFIDGNNYNLCADRGASGWKISATGPAGRIEFTLSGRCQPADDLVRGAVAAVGLLASRADCQPDAGTVP